MSGIGFDRRLIGERVRHGLRGTAPRPGNQRGVLVVDLDRFKAVNDTFGHGVGDQVLVAVGERLRAALPPADTVDRLRDDEFAIVLSEVKSERDVLDIGAHVLDALRGGFALDVGELEISASIGAAVASGTDADASALIADAYLGMYRAKARGRNRCELYEPGLRSQAAARRAAETTLRDAIGRAELRAHFQPVFALSTGAAVGTEALVRWHHPERGVLPPSAFIDLAEGSPLIAAIGEAMLEQACASADHLEGRGGSGPDPAPWVAVNLSPRELEPPYLVDLVHLILDRHGVDPARLVLEITERAAMRATRPMIRRLWEVHELGVRVAVDGFGAGCSSLDQLRRLPLDAIKIDRSVVAEIDRDADGTRLVAAIVAMSHRLGMAVTAVGVETTRQLELLDSLGCDHAQGHLLGVPHVQVGATTDPIHAQLSAARAVARDHETEDQLMRIISHA